MTSSEAAVGAMYQLCSKLPQDKTDGSHGWRIHYNNKLQRFKALLLFQLMKIIQPENQEEDLMVKFCSSHSRRERWKLAFKFVYKLFNFSYKWTSMGGTMMKNCQWKYGNRQKQEILMQEREYDLVETTDGWNLDYINNGIMLRLWDVIVLVTTI